MNVSEINELNISLDYFESDYNSTVSRDYPEPYNTIRKCVNWANIGMVLMSLVGNTMIIIVMTQKQNRKSSTCFLFTCLVVSDMCLAISVPFERWLHWTFKISLYGISPYITTAKTVLTYSNIQMSSWLLVCITVERVLSIAMPYKIKEICTRARAGVVIIVLCVVIIGLNTVGFNFVVAVSFDEAFGIIWVKKVENGETIIAWMDFIMAFFIPISFIILGSLYIIVHLLRISIQKTETKHSRNRSVTVTLLAANIVFVITMSPFVLRNLLYPSLHTMDVSPYLFWTLSEAFMFLSDMNSALNFFVYVLSGSRFRADVKQLFGVNPFSLSVPSPDVKRWNLLQAINTVTAFKHSAVSDRRGKTASTSTESRQQ